MLGNLISAGASLVGGLFGRSSQKDANKRNEAMQRDFAQNSISWRVADAKRAGVHPVYALGAPTVSVAPSHVGDSALPSAMSSMGQDLGRSVDAVRSGQERMDAAVQTLTLRRMALENDLLASQIAKINQVGSRPAFPGGRSVIDGQGDVPVLELRPATRMPHTFDVFGRPHSTGPGMDAEAAEQRYGDIVQEVFGIANLLGDVAHRQLPRIKRAMDRGSRVLHGF